MFRSLLKSIGLAGEEETLPATRAITRASTVEEPAAKAKRIDEDYNIFTNETILQGNSRTPMPPPDICTPSGPSLIVARFPFVSELYQAEPC